MLLIEIVLTLKTEHRYFISLAFNVEEIVVILITFLICLQGVAKYQRDISLTPFGLFALMIGTLVFFQIWMINPGQAAWILVESFSMVSAALSAFLATMVFAALPIAYSVFRLKHHKEPK